VLIIPYLDARPVVGGVISAASDAALIGRTRVGQRLVLGSLATLRADGHDIVIGDDCWFGDFATVHIAHDVYPAAIASAVSVARFALVHACRLGQGCVLAEHAVVMDDAQVGPHAVIAADSVVPPGKRLEGGWLYAGTPAKPVRAIAREEVEQLHRRIRLGGTAGPTGDGDALAHILRSARPVQPLVQRPGAGVAADYADHAYVAPSASITGELELGAGASIWFGVEAQGEGSRLVVGAGSNVQDNTRIRLSPGEEVVLGRRVTIGHNVHLAACRVEDEAMVGMGSRLGAGTLVQAGGCVAAGAVTLPGTVVGAGEIWSGDPATRWKPMPDENRRLFARGVDIYIEYAAHYARASHA